jgi:hypothetical protein
MQEAAQFTDTVPRIQQLAPHLAEQLMRLREGGTFEECRVRYGSTVRRLAAEGIGRQTASRVSDRDAYWAPTVDLLEEAMRLGFIARRPLPSSRRVLDAHRSSQFELTEHGRQVADLAAHDPGTFFDHLTEALYRAHPYFRSLLTLLSEAPLICPETSEGELEEGRRRGLGTDYWAQWGADRINSGPLGDVAGADLVKEELVTHVRRRFGSERPASKALSEAMNDAYSVASLKGRDLSIGATNLRILKAWCTQLLLVDQSRYVPGFNSCNVIWLAAEIDDENENDPAIHRRGFDEYGDRVASAIVDAYKAQARESESDLAAPYIPIYRVRAQAAFACGVTRALVDRVLEQVAAGKLPNLNVQMWLHLGRGDLPPRSEPVYRRGGTRRYEITMVDKRKEK